MTELPDLSGDLSAEDAKLVTLARATRARARAAEGAAVRDLDGRTYAAASIASRTCVCPRSRSASRWRSRPASTGLEAAVVLTDGDVVDVAAASDFAGAGVPVLVGDAGGRIHTRPEHPRHLRAT